ncbi:MAG TPA: hypothetical protein VKA08_13315 [Balneolales bacterium]|nr:hypothetical protein [Balneolales bacterium]
MVPISIGVTIALIAIGIVVVIAFGVKSIINGKVELSKVIYMAIPFVIFLVSLAIADDAIRAGIITMLMMLALMLIFIVVSGFRNLFNF